jgi:hypothetical protein
VDLVVDWVEVDCEWLGGWATALPLVPLVLHKFPVGGGGGIGDDDDAAASALAFNFFAEPRGDGFIGEIFATARFSACFELAPGTTNVWPPTMASRIVVADTLVVVSTNDFTWVST